MIFVSYSWIENEPDEDVLMLVGTLRKNGFDAQCDVMFAQNTTSISFREMMAKNLASAEKVLVVLSEGYKKKADEFTGGVGEEYRYIISDIADNEGKYVLATFSKDLASVLPNLFKGREVIKLDIHDGDTYRKLYYRLKGVPEFAFPAVNQKQPELNPKSILPAENTDDAPVGWDIKAGKKYAKSTGIKTTPALIPLMVGAVIVLLITQILNSENGYMLTNGFIELSGVHMSHSHIVNYLIGLCILCTLSVSFPYYTVRQRVSVHKRLSKVIAVICILVGSFILVDISYDLFIPGYKLQNLMGILSLFFFAIAVLIFRLIASKGATQVNGPETAYRYQETNAHEKPHANGGETKIHNLLYKVILPIFLASIPVAGSIYVAHLQQPKDIPISAISETLAPTEEPTPAPTTEPTLEPTPGPGRFRVSSPDEVENPLAFRLSSSQALNDNELALALDTILRRLDALGSPYYLEEENRGFSIVAMRSSFGNTEVMVDNVKRLVSSIGELCVNDGFGHDVLLRNADINTESIRMLEDPSDKDATARTYYFQVELTVPGVKRLANIIDFITSGYGGISINNSSFVAHAFSANREGGVVRLEFGGIELHHALLVNELLTGNALPCNFDVSGLMDWNYSHAEVADVRQPLVRFTLKQAPGQHNKYDDITDEQFETSVRLIRERMERIGKPFSISVDNRRITIATTPERMSYDIIRLVGKRRSIELYPQLGPAILDQSDIWWFNSYENFHFSLSSEGQAKLFNASTALANDAQKNLLYLMVNGVQVSSLAVTQPINQQELVFSNLLISKQLEITDENRFIIQLCGQIFDEREEMACDFKLVGGAQFEPVRDENGNPTMFGFDFREYPENQRIRTAIQPFEDEVAAEIVYDTGKLRFVLSLEQTPDLPERFMDLMRKIYDACDIDNGHFEEVIFTLDGLDAQEALFTISFDRTQVNGKMVSYGPIVIGLPSTEYMRQMTELFNRDWADYQIFSTTPIPTSEPLKTSTSIPSSPEPNPTVSATPERIPQSANGDGVDDETKVYLTGEELRINEDMLAKMKYGELLWSGFIIKDDNIIPALYPDGGLFGYITCAITNINDIDIIIENVYLSDVIYEEFDDKMYLFSGEGSGDVEDQLFYGTIDSLFIPTQLTYYNSGSLYEMESKIINGILPKGNHITIQPKSVENLQLCINYVNSGYYEFVINIEYSAGDKPKHYTSEIIRVYFAPKTYRAENSLYHIDMGMQEGAYSLYTKLNGLRNNNEKITDDLRQSLNKYASERKGPNAFVTASSTYEEYIPILGFDWYRHTAWIEDSGKGGIDEWIKIVYDSPVLLEMISISPGCQKNAQSYQEFNVPTKILVELSNGFSDVILLDVDEYDEEYGYTFYYDLPEQYSVNWIKLTILDIRCGKNNRAAITEVSV